MAEFQKNNKKGLDLLRSKFAFIVLICFVVIGIMGVVKTVPKMTQSSKYRKVAEAEYNKLSNQADSLREKIEKLKTEEGIEENIRDKYRVVKEGEGLVVILDEKDNIENSEGNATVESEKKTSNIREFLRNLF